MFGTFFKQKGYQFERKKTQFVIFIGKKAYAWGFASTSII